MKSQIIALFLSVFALQGFAAQESPDSSSQDIKNRVQQAISNCENNFESVKVMREKLENMKKPAFHELTLMKLYNSQKYILTAFDHNIAEFQNLLTKKHVIRSAPSVEQQRDLLVDFTSNCRRFHAGLLGFIDYALTGKADKISKNIYEGYINTAKCGKQVCDGK